MVLIGRLTRDPELRYTPGNGVAVCNFSLAVERPFTNRQGEREADFINIVTWRKQAEQCANHLGKGRLVAVNGRLQMRSYETQDGQTRRVAEVVGESVRFLDWPKNSNKNSGSNYSESGFGNQGSSDNSGSDQFGFGGEEYQVDDDDVPF
nr:single-stranded DNA-binding protein [Natranaerobius trueperi]